MYVYISLNIYKGKEPQILPEFDCTIPQVFNFIIDNNTPNLVKGHAEICEEISLSLDRIYLSSRDVSVLVSPQL